MEVNGLFFHVCSGFFPSVKKMNLNTLRQIMYSTQTQNKTAWKLGIIHKFSGLSTCNHLDFSLAT